LEDSYKGRQLMLCAPSSLNPGRKGRVSLVLAVLAPGQGAQTPGMLSPWLELAGVDAVIDAHSEVAGLDLRRLGTTAGADEIKDTAVTQPLIVALGLIVAGQLEFAPSTVVAGHSVGELTAAAVAGVLSPSDAVALAARRGLEMAAACALVPTGMTAVLGGDPDAVVAAIEAANLTPANRNGAGQIVAAGGLDQLAAFAADPPAGARLRPLPVAGAFHTTYMEPAQVALATLVDTLTVADPRLILLSNSDGSSAASGRDMIARIVAQITRPVRWDLCQATMADLGVSAAIELAPSGALVGMAKRELPGIELLAIKTPADLDSAREMIESIPEHGQGEHTLEFRVVVTPAKGVFTRDEGVVEGQPVSRGTRLGTVRTNRDEHAIVAPATGVLTEWLRNDGDIVAAGLPVVRLHDGSE
jgi:[acyl-carrier-protein] S-malonyltransferase